MRFLTVLVVLWSGGLQAATPVSETINVNVIEVPVTVVDSAGNPIRGLTKDNFKLLDQGKTRPIGISAFEDKLVQDAVREVLEAIYEQDFLECSYGFRPGHSAHDAVRTLKRIVDRGEVRWILEADIVSFFDSLDRTE